MDEVFGTHRSKLHAELQATLFFGGIFCFRKPIKVVETAGDSIGGKHRAVRYLLQGSEWHPGYGTACRRLYPDGHPLIFKKFRAGRPVSSHPRQNNRQSLMPALAADLSSVSMFGWELVPLASIGRRVRQS